MLSSSDREGDLHGTARPTILASAGRLVTPSVSYSTENRQLQIADLGAGALHDRSSCLLSAQSRQGPDR